MRTMIVHSQVWRYDVRSEYVQLVRPDGVKVVVILTTRPEACKIDAFIRKTIEETNHGQRST